jgi:cytochrome c biogenesis protein CcmG, thiol:disulfide interchange protein DsbE
MAALVTGKLAPDFTLPTLDGRQLSLHDLRQRGPVVLAFFKVSCPVCQYAFPMYERMAQAHKDSGATFLGVSQNKPSDANAFAREYGVTLPIAIDDEANSYAVSNAYGLTNVPTLFYIAPDGEIEVSSVGWSKLDVEGVNAKLAALRSQKPSVLWRPGESIQEFRAG